MNPQLNDPVRAKDSPPDEDGFYFVSLRVTYHIENVFVVKFVGGKWSSGGKCTAINARGVADKHAEDGRWLSVGAAEKLVWYRQTPDLFDV